MNKKNKDRKTSGKRSRRYEVVGESKEKKDGRRSRRRSIRTI